MKFSAVVAGALSAASVSVAAPAPQKLQNDPFAAPGTDPIIAPPVCALGGSSGTGECAAPLPTMPDYAEVKAMRDMQLYAASYKQKVETILRNRTEGCTINNVIRRREWGSTPPDERRAYIRALKCLAAKPNTISNTIVPGARNRVDDFTAAHILQTPYIHGNGPFLSFHRYMVHRFEKALRDECGYTGAQP